MSETMYKFSHLKKLWNFSINSMKIEDEFCNGCKTCVEICPAHALKPIKLEKATKTKTQKTKLFRIEKNNDLCFGCSRCKGFFSFFFTNF